MVKRANRLYFGQVETTSMQNKIDKFADYLDKDDKKGVDKAELLKKERMESTRIREQKKEFELDDQFEKEKNNRKTQKKDEDDVDNKERSSRDRRSQEEEKEERVELKEEEEKRKQAAQVPFMITKQMKRDLADLGYDKEDVMHLTPQRAHYIIQNQTKKENE